MGFARPFQGTKRFKIERRLGAGGFGVVYEALDRERDERVALKTLGRLDADALYRFKQEFRLLADVSSPYLVSLHELFSDGDVWFFTMDLVEGSDFLTYVTGQREPEMAAAVAHSFDDERLRWALSELALAVGALHETGRLHRDIKPSNVIVSLDGRVVLLDFGLVARSGSQGSTASVLGTVAYMAPEQALGHDLTVAADWYALGVMLYQALTGLLPHRGADLQVLLAKQEERPPPPRELALAVPEELSELAMRLLERDPGDRADGGAVLEVLGTVVAPAAGRDSLSLALSCDDPERADSPALVGRHEELARLWQAYQGVGRGRPIVVEVTGPSGMGKTALLASFTQRLLRRRGAVVLAGRCFEQESVPFKAVDAVIDALCRYLRSLDLPTASALMPRDVRALARLFPVLERVEAIRRAPAASAGIDSQELRQRAFGALAELLARIADRQPLVLLIDDLQWGDLDSALLLERLLVEADPPGMLLVLAYRSEERSRSAFLERLLGSPALRAVGRTVEVGALPEEAAQELARLILGPDESDARCAAIVAESGRNPLILSALARHATMVEAGEVTFELVVGELVAGLSEDARRLLAVVAIAGQPLALQVALAATALEAGGSRPFAELRVGRLLRACGGDSEQIECYHDRVREAVIAELAEARQREHHRALAEAFQSLGDEDPERLALHLEGAGELELAAEQAERAAGLAEEKLAFDRASQLYRRVLTFGRLDGARRLELLVKLGDALANAGRGGEAAEEYLKAAPGLPRLRALELKRRAALQLLGSGRVDPGIDVIGEVLAELDMRLNPNTQLALASAMVQRARLRLRGHRFEEIDPSQVAPGDLLRIDTCWAAVQGFSMTEATYALSFATRFLELALDLGEPYRVSLGLSLEATTLAAFSIKPTMQRRAGRALGEAEALAKKIDSPRAIAFNHFSAGEVASFCGRWREALERCDRASALFEERCTGVVLELAQTRLFALNALYHLGELREIARRAPLLIQAARARGDLFSSVGYLGGYGFLAWLAQGDVVTTRRELEQARRSWSVSRYMLQDWLLDSAEVQTALSIGEGRGAWGRLEPAFDRLRRTPYYRSDFIRCDGESLRGAAAVAAALEARPGSATRTSLLRQASQALRALEQQRFPSAGPSALLLQACVTSAAGRRGAAERALAVAAADFDAVDMAMHGAVARRCRGALLGGDEGGRLEEEADRVLSDLGAAAPERLVAMLAPGL